MVTTARDLAALVGRISSLPVTLGLTIYGNGTTTSYAYAYDCASRLSALTQAIAGAGMTLGYGYNPAGQIRSRTSSNDAYAWTGRTSAATMRLTGSREDNNT